MKSFNVKSNAKRAAKKLAAQFPGYSVLEPVPVSEGAREWYPALAAPGRLIAEGVPEDVKSTAYINGKDMSDAAAALTAIPAEVAATVAGGSVNVPATVKAVTAEQAAAMAAALPPPVQSTKEEIEARRAERRARIEQEKVSGIRDTSGAKRPETKAAKILEMVGRDGGATLDEMSAALEWQRHTLRGYIAGTLRKRLKAIGKTIESRRVRGEPTVYVIVDLKDDDDE